LLNALARRDVAIVTDIAGTTRDLLEVDLDLDGFLVRLTDTAGLRDTTDVVEREGVRRARLVIETADLVLLLEEIDSGTELSSPVEAADILKVGTKLDLHPEPSETYDCLISVADGSGFPELLAVLRTKVQEKWASIAALGPGRARHIQHLKQASLLLGEALLDVDLDLRAESLRLAGESLGRITGRTDAEDLLDVIFSEFCIGK
jgi:tRNA modification GTPase